MSRKKGLLIAIAATVLLMAICFGASAIFQHRTADNYGDYRNAVTLDPALYKGRVHDTHGGHCAICVGEAIDAGRMYEAGTPVGQIRDALRARYNRRES